MSNPPAGWYPDPTGQPNTIRWWNGKQWTNRTEKEEPSEAGATPVEVGAESGVRAGAGASAEQVQSGQPQSGQVQSGQAHSEWSQSEWSQSEWSPQSGWTTDPNEPRQFSRAAVEAQAEEVSAFERARATWNAPEIAPAPPEHWTQQPIPEEPLDEPAEAAPQENGFTLKLAPSQDEAAAQSTTAATEATARDTGAAAGGTVAAGAAGGQGWASVSWTQQPNMALRPADEPRQDGGWGIKPDGNSTQAQNWGQEQEPSAAGSWGTQEDTDGWANQQETSTDWGVQQTPEQDTATEGWGTQQSAGTQPWGEAQASDQATVADGWGTQQGSGEADPQLWGTQQDSGQGAATGWGSQQNTEQEAGPQLWGAQQSTDGWGQQDSGQQAGPQLWGAQQGSNQDDGNDGWGAQQNTEQQGVAQAWGAQHETGQDGGWGARQESGQQGAGGGWGTQGSQVPWGAQQGEGQGWAGQQGWQVPEVEPDGGSGRGGKGKQKKDSGGSGSSAKLPLIVAGAVVLVMLVVAAVFLITSGDDKQAGPTPTPTSQPTGTQPTSQPTNQSSTRPGQSKNPKLHEGGRIASDAISFPRRTPPWSDRKRLVPQLLNSSGQYVLLQENFDGKNDWYADIFVGALGTASGFNGDPKATAAALSTQLRSSLYGDIPVTFRTVSNGAVKRSGKSGWYVQQTVTAKSAKLTARVLTLTVAVFDLGDGTAVAYISDIPTNRPDLRTAESQAYKGINVG